ncbi:DEAD/DEAH box helicase [Celeribacter indicus]|uniref:Putative ATP-dependent RNA helicase n=2 Tax=Celeribacter indicus TaxID=1208324 RepID=A0A0B5E569_9RHOB|nr:DEAD/DEAH box helicase [Celeribacter indicus]AJE47507.1 putative ATP-dependent RNA helicase [Celeribacter indicus]SDW08680.1 ATP-dependent RNA helicase RhlE [Celeribacter indicus]
MTFNELGLNARMVSRLASLGLNTPTPIQQKAIPHALQGRDVLGIAQTGTGKTAAFGIPLVVALSKSPERPAPRSVRGLVLAPTRELAGQIVQSLGGLTSDLRITLVVGGKSINAQAARLSRGTDILVATPGRLIDLLDRRAVDLGQTRFLVLDEADQMLDIGFIHALRRIAPMLGKERQTMMFSATMPKTMADLSREYLSEPVRVEASPPGKVADKVTHSVHFVTKEGKQDLLIGLLHGHREDRALVFSRTKHGAERLMKQLDRAGFATASIHGNKSQGQRDRALGAFRDGSVHVLVATDVAARGIDIPGVGHVYNFDLPNVPENYVHRIGRTARAGRDGRAIAFCAADEVTELKAIEKVLGMRVAVAGGRPWEATDETPKPQKRRRSRRRAGGRPERMVA